MKGTTLFTQIATLAIVAAFGLASIAEATVLTFDTGQGNNADLSLSFGSTLSTDIAGASVHNGSTPDVALSWAPSPNVWEIHGAASFGPVGDGKIVQLDLNGGEPDPTVTFTVAAGAALQLNSVVIGHATDMSEPANTWTITIAESGGGPTVFTHTTAALGAGNTEEVCFDFLGDAGTDYMLTFDDGGANHVRAAIDNLSFNQVAVGGTTVLTFDTGQANNADLALSFGSNLSSDTTGALVVDGGTPDIALTWAPSPNVLCVHGAASFDTIDPSGCGVDVLQLDLNGGEADPTVTFAVATGRLRINSLVIGHATDMSEPANSWTITIAEDGGPQVFSHSTAALGAGDTEVVTINFLGEWGTDYVLKFDDGGADHFRAAIDNLSFSQVDEENTTVLTFDTGQSNNDAISSAYGSNISVDGPGVFALGGGTPNIGLTWSNVWDAHGRSPTTAFDTIDPVENTSSTDVGQMDQASGATITFAMDGNYRLELNSLLIGQASDHTEPAFGWTITITEDGGPQVFSHTTANLDGNGSPATEIVTFGFTGDFGVDYVLEFSTGSPVPYRSAIDNLNFSQTRSPATVIRFK